MKTSLVFRLSLLAFFLTTTVPVFAQDSDSDGMSDVYEAQEGYNPAVYTQIYYVDDEMLDDTGNGLTEGTAKKYISSGLTLAKVNDGKEYVVLVKPGVYSGTSNTELNYSGYDIKLRSINGAAVTVIDCEETYKAFDLNSGETIASWIEGFTIKNGSSANYGGAIRLRSGSSPTIKKCVFENNSSVSMGGAIYGYNSSLIIQNCRFDSNDSLMGGALAFTGNTTFEVDMVDCSLVNNSAKYGGAIQMNLQKMNITGCNFVSNTGINDGGAIYFNAAAADIKETIFADNSVTYYGGAICTRSDKTFNFTNCLFLRNTGGRSALCCRSNSPTYNVTHSTFTGNTPRSIYAHPNSIITLNVMNSIAWNSITTTLGAFTINYSNTIENYTGQGVGNLSTDPLLTSAGWLTTSSPSKDSGSDAGVTVDIQYEARPAALVYDMGSDEFIDTNSNGVPDWYEDQYGDGVDDLAEYTAETDPTLGRDADGDRISDIDEKAMGLDPNNSTDPGLLEVTITYPAKNEIIQ